MKPGITTSRYGPLVMAFLIQAMFPGLGRAQPTGWIIWREGDDARETRLETNLDDATGSPAAPEAELALEDLRAVLHLYSRLDRPERVEVIAGRILSRHPRDKETLQLLAAFYLERRDAPRALKFARALVEFHPGDGQTHFQLAMAYKLDGQPRAATEVLQKLKAERFQGRHFPYETELAYVALASGDWPLAVRSYQSAIENPSLRSEERTEARNQLDQLYQVHMPQLLIKEAFTHSKSGLILRSLLDWSQPMSARHRLQFELERDDLKLNEAPSLRAQRTARYDGLVGLESAISQWRTRLFGGMGDEGAVYGFDLARAFGQAQALTLAFHGNQRATDSLLLEVLHGREAELALLWNARFGPGIDANLKLGGRRVLVEGETLAYGYGVALNLERAVLEAVPELHLGYRGLITGESQSSDDIRLVGSVAASGTTDAERLGLLEDLISPINLHGFYLSWHQTINPEWKWLAVLGGDYSFTRSSFGSSFEAGVSYAPSRSTEIILGGGYSTSASTSDQDSKRLELSLAFRCRF